MLLPEEPLFQPVLVHPAPLTGEAPAERETAPPDGEIPAHLLQVPGLLGRVQQWVLDTSRRPQPGLALASAICVLGTAAGRTFAGPTESGTHLYVLGLAPTSAGKDHGLKQARRLLAESGLGKVGEAGQWMSMSALVRRMLDSPLTLTTIDEMGSYLGRINSRSANNHERAITGTLREMWGSSFDTVSTPAWANEPSRDIHSPALSILGVSTHEDLYSGFQGGDIQNGFLNRFLLISTMVRPPEREPPINRFHVPALLANDIKAIAETGNALTRMTSHSNRADPPAVIVQWAGDAAQRVYQDFGRLIEAREADQAFLGRAVEMAVRLATIRAIGIDRTDPRITVEDMTWARDLTLWAGEQMIRQASEYMAGNETESQLNRLHRKVKECGSIGHSKLLKFYKGEKRSFAALMETLEDRGDVIKIKDENAARLAFIYVAA